MEQKIIDLYKNGCTGRQIAKIVGISFSSVYKIIKKHSIESNRPKQNYRCDIDNTVIIKLRENGMSMCQIARKLKCSSTMIQNRLRNL